MRLRIKDDQKSRGLLNLFSPLSFFNGPVEYLFRGIMFDCFKDLFKNTS